jgi:hypothetical protein
MPLFYGDDTVTRSGNSQFGARNAFHLVKWVLAAAPRRKHGASGRISAPVLLMLQRMMTGGASGQIRHRV